jgi:hypothetical protein
MPEVLYHLVAREIPKKKDGEGYSILIGFKEPFLLRRLVVSPEGAAEWELEVYIGKTLAMRRVPATELSEDREILQWPNALHPKLVQLHAPVKVVLYARDTEKRSDRFECVFRGAEAQ